MRIERLKFSKVVGLLAFAFILALGFGQSKVYAQDVVEATGLPTDQASIDAGKSLFKSNCKSCHAMDKKLVGPALQGVNERRELPWLKSWITNAPKMIKEKDPIALELYEEYKSVMSAFPTFTEAEVLSILAYIKSWKPEEVVATVGDKGVAVSSGASAESNDTFVLILGVLLVVLVLIVIVLILMAAILKKTLRDKKDLDDADLEQLNQTHSVIKVVTHRGFITVVVIFALLTGFLLGLKKGLYTIGVQQGYSPTQPIPFSHKIHAGEHEIDCNYCHTGVRKAKHANIPSANICMNCHSEIKTGSPLIAKIHEAVDYNPDTKQYGNNTKPIKWVRIHNLPDHVYFNHAQHVKVGGIECETCHGSIKEMEVVRQYSPLTMGWCIDCHRKTAVNAEGNDYYDKLLEVHKNESKEPMTVEDIGGLECAKCHY